MNTHVRDNLLYLYSNLLLTGMVRQVVQGSTTSAATSAANTYADTNLTATITPTSTSNKVLVLISQAFANSVSGDQIQAQLLRGASAILTPFWDSGTYTSTLPYIASAQYLDSPASVSALTYKTQFKRASGSGGNVNAQLGSRVSGITLMEIVG